MSLLSPAELRSRQWLASTDNPTATTLAVLTEPEARGNREDCLMPNEPEKSTNQLAVWWHLVDILEQLGAVWQDTRAATGAVESLQLPANLAVALVRSGGHGAEVAAGVAAVLAQQADSGGRFRQLASAARAVDDGWPRRDDRIDLGRDATSHNGAGLR